MTTDQDSASETTNDVPPKKKFKMRSDHKDFIGNMTRREAAWLLYGLICFACNYTVFRILPGPLSWWTVAQIVLIGIFLCALSVWILWTQINSIEISTRDEAPIIDKHGSDDMGWTYWTYVLFGAMYVLAGFGLLTSILTQVLSPGSIPEWVPNMLYVSWPIILYTPFMYALTRIDLGPIATLYQRNNRLRTKLTRFEEQSH
jgi:hypothetical protein